MKKIKNHSQATQGAFFNLKTTTKVLAITALLMMSSAHAAWWEVAENASQQPAEETKNQKSQKPSVESQNEAINPKTVNVSLEEEIEFLKKISFSAEEPPYSSEESVYFAYDEESPPQNAAETMALVNAKIAAALSKTNFNFNYEPPPYVKDPEAFQKFQRSLFESLASLADQAQEPLFLDNKQQFSVEVRPFVGHTPNSCGTELGVILTPRYHWQDSYISGQFLYATSSKKSSEVAGSLTYGHFFNQVAASMTLVGGHDWASFLRKDDRRSYRSNPKVWSLGLSPMLVYYMPTKVPLDLFLGGDVYYSRRSSLEESSDGETCTYDADNDVLWRVKAGPSYTMKREGKARLYQLKFSLAGNVQSQVPDRFTVAPNFLFESQPLEGRGGYLFNLGFNLGSQKKSWQLAYGLRF
jgi:hypothetical protein